MARSRGPSSERGRGTHRASLVDLVDDGLLEGAEIGPHPHYVRCARVRPCGRGRANEGPLPLGAGAGVGLEKAGVVTSGRGGSTDPWSRAGPAAILEGGSGGAPNRSTVLGREAPCTPSISERSRYHTYPRECWR